MMDFEAIADRYADKDDPLLIRMTRAMFIAEMETAVRNEIVRKPAPTPPHPSPVVGGE